MKIAVLAGGLSPEREVSLSSGSLIANALVGKGHRVALADIYLGLDTDSPDESAFGRESYPVHVIENREPDLEAVVASNGGQKALIGRGIIRLCELADAVFLALHGGAGENGMVQAALECAGITHYTGTGYVGALLAMDKGIAKQLMAEAGVPVPAGIVFDAESDSPERIVREVGFPCVVKPCSCGSSVGVSRVRDAEELSRALSEAACFERELIVERMIEGRELTCAVLDGRALPPVEIIPKKGWYDYENKYQAGATEEICPAPLTDAQTGEIGRLALLAFGSLRMETYGRADFILSNDGRFYCLEVNALPGMTPTSLLPQEAAAVGIGYAELCEIIVGTAVAKRKK